VHNNLVAAWTANSSGASAPKPASSPKPRQQLPAAQTRPLDLTINWRFRTGSLGWFEAATPAQNAYAFDTRSFVSGSAKKSSASNGC